MLPNWKTKTDSKGNIVFYNPIIAYKYDSFNDGFLNNSITKSTNPIKT